VYAVAVGNLGPRASTEVVWAKAGKTAKAAANNQYHHHQGGGKNPILHAFFDVARLNCKSSL
jgi:hypothetical protein